MNFSKLVRNEKYMANESIFIAKRSKSYFFGHKYCTFLRVLRIFFKE